MIIDELSGSNTVHTHTQFTLKEVYIDAPGNEDWWERYKYDIPVFHINGEYLMKHRVNERLLLKRLDQLKQ